MFTFDANSDIALPILFQRDGEPFVPDGGSFSYELRGPTGAVIVSKTTVTGVDDSRYVLNLDDALAVLSSGVTSERRTLVVTGLAGGAPFRFQIIYRVSAWINMDVSPSAIRTFVGVDDSTLPDSEIDTLNAYYDLADRVTESVLTAALTGTDQVYRGANKAILAQTVLNLLPSFQVRISKSETDGTMQAQRFDIDLLDLESRARDLMQLGLSAFITTEPVVKQLLLFNLPTDPVTGA